MSSEKLEPLSSEKLCKGDYIEVCWHKDMYVIIKFYSQHLQTRC